MPFHDVYGKLQLIESLPAKLEVPEFDIPRPNADFKLSWVEVLDVHAQEAVEKAGD
jgi:hypothetical protein